jgi:hypothetical protein
MSTNNTIIREERAGDMFGVDGRFHNVVVDPDNPHRIVSQTFVASRNAVNKPAGHSVEVNVRFDDNCDNGHETFAITGVLYQGFKDVAHGCIHDEIAETFPELQPLLKWHLCSTDGPMHYLENTLYLAGNRDHWGLLEGEPSTNPCHMRYFVQFGDVPIKHKVDKWLKEFIEGHLAEHRVFVPEAVLHSRAHEGFKPRWRFYGMSGEWQNAPFKTAAEAEQWALSLNTIEVSFSAESTLVGTGKARELDAARRTAIWPEATDDELCADRFVLSKLLLARLPQLLSEFKQTMTACGFIYPELPTDAQTETPSEAEAD